MMANNDGVTSTPGGFRLRWDAFLSFRGTDTRDSFTKNLYDSLHSNGVRVFRDDDGLDRGHEIAPSLLEAINDSAASIIIISPNYASSHWCLEELAEICDCDRLILPVFYRVDPSDVRKQKGPFEEAFRTHERRFEKEKVLRWRGAMKKVGGVAGWVLREEATLVRFLVKRVLRELSNIPVAMATYTVGLEKRVEEVIQLLDLKSNGVKVLGLYGMGGVGKTTLAKALFNRIVGHFGRRKFLSDVRKISSKNDGLVSLKDELKDDFSPVNENRVLLVLDDVDDVKQLDTLIGRRELLYEGSRIVVTTRNRDVLVNNHVNEIYEVKELMSSDALKLFCHHALGRKKPAGDNFLNLSKQIVSLTGGLPLALEVFGSFLFDKRRVEEWDDALKKLKRIRPDYLQDVLKISFDGLDEEVKCVFLDLACFFVEMKMKREDVIDILRGCGFGAETAISVLTQRSLIKVFEKSDLWMHDQVRDMGRQLVRQENLVDPGMRSRLWDLNEIMTVLKDEKGTRCIQGIVLDFRRKTHAKDPSGDKISWNNLLQNPSATNALAYLKESYKKYTEERAEKAKAVIVQTKQFESMVNLRLLQINNLRLEGKFKFFPAEVKWLQWKECPYNSMPSDFCPRDLAVLDLSESNIEKVWGRCSNKVAESLMVMNLSSCCYLVSFPDLSGCGNLEKIVLEGCVGLMRLHESIGNLSKLHHLNLRRCSNLIALPNDISGLKNLDSLVLSGCSKLKELPENIGHMKSLKELLLDGTAIAALPGSIFCLEKLEILSLDGCQLMKKLPNCIGSLSSLLELSLNDTGLEELPDSVGFLRNLIKLRLMWCKSLTKIPDAIGNLTSLTELMVNSSGIGELPASIGSLSCLRDLSVGECKFLTKLPDSLEALASLIELQLDGTAITNLPYHVGTMKMLRKLEIRNCKNLRFLPESIGKMSALTTLNMFNTNITELPESFGMLESLFFLRLNKCRYLRKLPASIGNLQSLVKLMMEETAVTELPESFGMLSSLVTLKMAKKPELFPTGNSMLGGVENPSTQDAFELPSSFCNLTMLEELDARAWRICGRIPQDFEKLSSLEILNLGQNDFCSLPSSLKGLSILKKLLLPECINLVSLPPLPSSLLEVNIAHCTALESIPDISNLESLQELNLTNCEKVIDIPGLECLRSLRRLFMSGCTSCSSAVKKRFSKVSLRNSYNLSIPGNRIPNWFLGESITFSKCKNRELKYVIIGVVVSLNDYLPAELRNQLPGVVEIQANILKLDKLLFSTTLNLRGVPKTNEEHIHLCRFPDYHPLVSKLKDGYTLSVTKRNPPALKGVELQKCGIYLVFEGDDDYEGDEPVDEKQQSVSEKLANFFKSSEKDDPFSGPDCEDEIQKQLQMKGQEKRKSTSSYSKINFILVFIVSFVFLFLSWLWLRLH